MTTPERTADNEQMSPRCEDDAAVQPESAHRPSLYWLISLPLAAVLLYFALRGVEWRRVWQIASAAHLMLLGLACLVATISYIVRSVRWRILLGAGQPIPFATVFWSNSAGYLANNFLPARTGEVLRSAMVSARTGLSKTYVLTTALAERMVDALALMTISSVVLLSMPSKAAWLAAASRPFAVIGIGGAIAIAVLPRAHGLIEKLLVRVPLPEKLRRLGLQMTGQILLGVRSFHRPARLVGFCSLTAVIWFLDAASSVIIARALGLDLGFAVALLMITGIGLSSALPSTPGNVGVFQFVTVSVLVPFGFSHSDALAYALIGQALNYLVVAFWGLLALWRYHV